jgi:hypothetical protein
MPNPAIRNALFRTLSGLMAALFAFGAVVQLNDPDPLRWVAIYAATAAPSTVAALRGSVAPRWTLPVGTAAAVWGVSLALDVESLVDYRSMFDAWEMQSVSIEIAREASGLFMIAVWMGALSFRGRRTRGR